MVDCSFKLKLLALPICVVFVASSSMTKANDDTFTQIGPWRCVYPPFPTERIFPCKKVLFDKQFADKPEIVFVNNIGPIEDLRGRLDVGGFQPLLRVGGGSRGRPPHGGEASGYFIAVGRHPPQVESGHAKPRYVVLMVMYAPPGSNGGKNTCSVTYAVDSSAGTTTSASNTFKQSYGVSVTGSYGKISNIEGSLSFTYSKTDESTDSLEIKKSKDKEISLAGPSVDGINHDYDVIVIWLNPEVNLAMTSNSGEWTFADSDKAVIRQVPVAWLKNPLCRKDDQHKMCIPDNVREDLKKYGLNESEWPEIVRRDPLANADPSAPLDPNRFASINMNWGYYPPPGPTDQVPVLKDQRMSSRTISNESKATDAFGVGVTLTGTAGFADIAKVSFKNINTWDWTYTSSKMGSAGKTETALLTIGGPSYNYPQTAPSELNVFIDKIYKTFAFTLEGGHKIALKGTVVSASKGPVSGADVYLHVNGVEQRTFTNNHGEWTFFGVVNGPCDVASSTGASQKISDCGITRSDIVLQQP